MNTISLILSAAASGGAVAAWVGHYRARDRRRATAALCLFTLFSVMAVLRCQG
jgi:hypothetical protein